MAPKAPPHLVTHESPSTSSRPIVSGAHPTPRDTKIAIVRQNGAPAAAEPATAARSAVFYQSIPGASAHGLVGASGRRRVGVDSFSCCVSLLCCLLLVACCFLTAAIWRLTLSV